MPRLRRFSGSEVKEIFQTFGFETISQKGSHVKMRRFSDRTSAENALDNDASSPRQGWQSIRPL